MIHIVNEEILQTSVQIFSNVSQLRKMKNGV